MSNKTRHRPAPKAPARSGNPANHAPATSAGRRSPVPWIVAGVVAVIVLVAGIVAISSGGDSDDATPATEAPGASGDGSGVALEQVRPVTISGAPLTPLTDPANDSAVGAAMPTVTGQSFDGTPVSIEPGTPTLLVFVAHWCPHCQAEVPRLVEWNADGEVPDGIDVIAVSTAVTDQRDNYPPSAWMADEEWPWPVLADSATGEVSTAFGLSAFPFFVFVDADGTVAFRGSGEVPMDDLTAQIEDALAA